MAATLRVLHCFRAPLGGLFRHVRDLVAAQTEMGCNVAVICDSARGSDDAEKALQELDQTADLGLWRVPMSRALGVRDIIAARHVQTIAAHRFGIHVLHGHGAKGGAYARLVARHMKARGHDIKAVYTPHGGSLHYDERSLSGRVYLALERRLAPLTDGLIFESAFSARGYESKVGRPDCWATIIANGLHARDFTELQLDDLAADFLFVGELRRLKGVDVLLEALAIVAEKRPARAVIVGSGSDEAAFKKLARQLRLETNVIFAGPMPAPRAFVRGRCLVVPSRAESFPYIVLEGAAARKPMILSAAGGIPEIVEGSDMTLVPPDDVEALAAEMEAFLITPSIFIERAQALAEIVSERYTVDKMAQSVVEFYHALFTNPLTRS